MQLKTYVLINLFFKQKGKCLMTKWCSGSDILVIYVMHVSKHLTTATFIFKGAILKKLMNNRFRSSNITFAT